MKWIPDSGTVFQSLLVKLGFWIFIERDTGFLEQYSGFQSLRFRVPRAKFSRIPDFTNNYFTDSGFQ